jgi:hypothetical protein
MGRMDDEECDEVWTEFVLPNAVSVTEKKVIYKNRTIVIYIYTKRHIFSSSSYNSTNNISLLDHTPR